MRAVARYVVEHDAPRKKTFGRLLLRLLSWGVRIGIVGLTVVVVSAALSATSAPDTDAWRAGARGGPLQLQDAMALGKEPDGALYACRGLVKQDMHVGRIRADFGGCHIGFDGREVEVKPFELLSVTWKPGDAGTAAALVAGTERIQNADTPFATTTLYVCRTAYMGSTHSGQARGSEKGCSFGFGGKRVVATTYDVLQVAPWLSWVSATARTLPDGAVVSGMEGGEPFYACRAGDKNGLHPGKVKRGPVGCSIVSDGREATIDRFEVLAPRWVGGHAGTTPVGAFLAGRENGEGQFVCRAQAKDSVQIGKVSEALEGCHVGMQGREVIVSDYDVLSQ